MQCSSCMNLKQSIVPLYPSVDFTFAAQNNMFPFTYSLNPSFVIVDLIKRKKVTEEENSFSANNYRHVSRSVYYPFAGFSSGDLNMVSVQGKRNGYLGTYKIYKIFHCSLMSERYFTITVCL